MARTSAFLVLAALPLLAGCLDDTAVLTPDVERLLNGTSVRGADGRPVAYAQFAALADDEILVVTSARSDGLTDWTPPPAATQVRVGAPGYAAQTFPADALPARIDLVPDDRLTAVTGLFQFRAPVDLLCPIVDPPTLNCDQFGEPVLEVAGDGTVWYSATCCVGKSPPIWTSRDEGHTFQLLQGEGTGLIRDATGIEGDFAIDEAGNVYFFDILAGASWITSYTADGTHRWTLPMSFPPLVDRPWVRAAGPDEVYIVYNTGTSTRFYASNDGGQTWSLDNDVEFPCGLGTFGQHVTERHTLYVAAVCGGGRQATVTLWTSTDAGATWDEGRDLPMPEGRWQTRGLETTTTPFADEAGNVYVSFIHDLPRPAHVDPENWSAAAVHVARVSPDGSTWLGRLGPDDGIATKPWLAAGAPGHVALAWYQAEGPRDTAASPWEWKLLAAASVNADAEDPQYQITQADPEVLATGPFGRQLGDFLEARLTPDGRLAIAYAKAATDEADQPDNQVRFVASRPGIDLGPNVFLNGPRAA